MEGDKETYKKMFEMGQELQEMARACGYDPDSAEESGEVGEDDESAEDNRAPMATGQNKTSLALSLLGR